LANFSSQHAALAALFPSTGTAGNTVSIGATQAGTETVAAKDLAATNSIALTGITVTGTKSVTVIATSNALSLATLDASGFTGDTFSSTASSASTKAINVKANGAYRATITTTKGADTMTLGDPGTSLGHNVVAGDGADAITSGSGNDVIDAGDGNNIVVGGAAVIDATLCRLYIHVDMHRGKRAN
jgi:Ca2+-binding RTX toxin-like protein